MSSRRAVRLLGLPLGELPLRHSLSQLSLPERWPPSPQLSFARSPSPNGPWPRAQAATGLASFVSLLGDHSAVLLFCFLSYNLTTVI